MRRGTRYVVAKALRDAAEGLAKGESPKTLRQAGAERRAASWQRVKQARELRRQPVRPADVWADPSALLPAPRVAPVGVAQVAGYFRLTDQRGRVRAPRRGRTDPSVDDVLREQLISEGYL